MGEWTERYGSQATKQKLYVGLVTNYFSKLGVAEVKTETNDLKSGDEFLVIGPTTGVVEGKAEEIRIDLKPAEIAKKEAIASDRYVMRLLNLRFLAPDIIERILKGTQPKGLTVEKLTNINTPIWSEQRSILGF